MTISKEIENRVGSFPSEVIFTIKDLGLPLEWWETIRVKLGRMVKNGMLKKIGKGRFYRPEITIFGEIPPTKEELVRDLLIKDGKIIGYVTGYTRWHQMGLTTQISGIIQIATNTPKRNINRGLYSVRFIKQPNVISEDNIKYLTLLDAINNIKKIPDASINESLLRLSQIVERLKLIDIERMISLAHKYPARTRALLGLILDQLGHYAYTESLLRSLNPLSTYHYSGITAPFTNLSKWHIK